MSRFNPCINCGSTNAPTPESDGWIDRNHACAWKLWCEGCGWSIRLAYSAVTLQDIEAMWNRLWDMQQTAEKVHKLGVDLQGEAMKNVLKDMEE